MQNRVVIDETGERVFVEADAGAAQSRLQALEAEGRKVYIAAREPHEIAREVVAKAESVIAGLRGKWNAVAAALRGGQELPQDHDDYSSEHAAAVALRTQLGALSAENADLTKRHQDAAALVVKLGEENQTLSDNLFAARKELVAALQANAASKAEPETPADAEQSKPEDAGA